MCEVATEFHPENHEVVALKDLAPSSTRGPLLCTQHSLSLSIFCQTCESLECSSCLFVSHQGHKGTEVEKESATRLSLLQTTAGKALTLKQLLQRDIDSVKAERTRIQARAEEQNAVITMREEQVPNFYYLIKRTQI